MPADLVFAAAQTGSMQDASVHGCTELSAERYMEYLCDHGQFADLPVHLFFAHLAGVYPHLFSAGGAFLGGDLQAEAALG